MGKSGGHPALPLPMRCGGVMVCERPSSVSAEALGTGETALAGRLRHGPAGSPSMGVEAAAQVDLHG